MKKYITYCPVLLIIVCLYNNVKCLEKCVRSFLQQDFIKKIKYEVILLR